MENYANRYATLCNDGKIYWGQIKGKNHIIFDFKNDLVGIEKKRTVLSFISPSVIHWEPMITLSNNYTGSYIYDYIDGIITGAYLSEEQIKFQKEMIQEGEGRFLIQKVLDSKKVIYKFYDKESKRFINILQPVY